MRNMVRLPDNLPSVKLGPFYVGIVGHAADKFAPQTKSKALEELLSPDNVVLVSGHCHLGGIDIWAETIAKYLGRPSIIYPPKTLQWSTGYKPRNLLIARKSNIVHVIVVRDYPPHYCGMRFGVCYHCGTSDHIKSGGCWTALKCRNREWYKI